MRCHSFLPASLLLLSLAASSTLARAETGFTLKGGAMNLWDNTQTLDGTARAIDDTSQRTFAIGVEHRRRNGAAFGMEYLNYRNAFTPPAGADTGLAKTEVLQFIARKYFLREPVVHPFLGLGIGTSRTTVSFDTPTAYTKYDWTLALQLNGGVEFLLDENFSASVEIKTLYSDVDNVHYDPSATGIFFGAAVLF